MLRRPPFTAARLQFWRLRIFRRRGIEGATAPGWPSRQAKRQPARRSGVLSKSVCDRIVGLASEEGGKRFRFWDWKKDLPLWLRGFGGSRGIRWNGTRTKCGTSSRKCLRYCWDFKARRVPQQVKNFTSSRQKRRWERIYAVVRRIPRRRVATYGQVAALAGSAAPRPPGWLCPSRAARGHRRALAPRRQRQRRGESRARRQGGSRSSSRCSDASA